MARPAKRNLDFTNVKDAAVVNPVRVPEGDYVLEIIDVEEGSSDKNDYWNFICRMKNRRSAVYPYRCTLNEASLWKIRNLFVACGLKVPKKKVAVDPAKLIGKTFGATMVDDEYKDKPKSEINGVFPASDVQSPPTKAPPEDEDVEDVDEEEIEDEVDVEDL